MSINRLKQCNKCKRYVHIEISDLDINLGLFRHLYEMGMDWFDFRVYLDAEEQYNCHECLKRLYPHEHLNVGFKPYTDFIRDVAWKHYAEFMTDHEHYAELRLVDGQPQLYIHEQTMGEFLETHVDVVNRPAFVSRSSNLFNFLDFAPICSSCHNQYAIRLGSGDDITLNAILTLTKSDFQRYSHTALQGQGFVCWRCLRQNATHAGPQALFMNHLGVFLLSHSIATTKPTEATRPGILPAHHKHKTVIAEASGPLLSSQKWLAIFAGPQISVEVANRIRRAENAASPLPDMVSGIGTSAAGLVGLGTHAVKLWADANTEIAAYIAKEPVRKETITEDALRTIGALGQITGGGLTIADAAGSSIISGGVAVTEIGGQISGGAGLLLGVISLADGLRVTFNNLNAIKASAELFTILGSQKFLGIVGQRLGITGPVPDMRGHSDAEFKKMFWAFTHDPFWASAMWMSYKYHPSWRDDLLKLLEQVGMRSVAICTSIISICVVTTVFPPIAGVTVAGYAAAVIGSQSARVHRFRKSREGFEEIMEGRLGAAFTDPTIVLSELTLCEQPLGEWKEALNASIHSLHSMYKPRPTMGDYYRFTVAIYLYKAIIEGRISRDPPAEGFPTVKSGVSSARLSEFLARLKQKPKVGEPNDEKYKIYERNLAELSEIVNKSVQDSMVVLFWNIIKHRAKYFDWTRAYDKALKVAVKESMYKILSWINDMEEAYNLTAANRLLFEVEAETPPSAAAAVAASAPPRVTPVSPEVASMLASHHFFTQIDSSPGEQKNSKIFHLPPPNVNHFTALELCGWANNQAEIEANPKPPDIKTPDMIIRSHVFLYCAISASVCVIAQAADGIAQLLGGLPPIDNSMPDINHLYNNSKLAAAKCLKLLYIIHPIRGTHSPNHPEIISGLAEIENEVKLLFNRAKNVFESVNKAIVEYKNTLAPPSCTSEFQNERLEAIKKICDMLER